MISQDLFDETLLESQELFEYSDDQAVQETISELQSGKATVRLDHLSLSHPNSPKGKADREKQKEFVRYLHDQNLPAATDLLTFAADEDSTSLPVYLSLILKHGFLAASGDGSSSEQQLLTLLEKNEDDIERLVCFILSLLPDTITFHPLARDIKLLLLNPLKESWCTLYRNNVSLRVLLVKFARVCCNACEANKKTFVQACISFRYDTDKNGLHLLLESLPKAIASNSNDLTTDRIMTREVCKLLTIIGKFQASAEPHPKDGDAPLVSSAHANVKELHRCGAVRKLQMLAKQCTGTHNEDSNDMEELLCDLLSALRVMAIDNDIVQTMVAVGILETADASLLVNSETGATTTISAPLAGATLGLLRNLCANDEIKTNICKKSVSPILHVMEVHATNHTVQEHGCGIFAAMALRQPNNAMTIVQANGINHILAAMRAFPTKVPLQRQGCLALRNISSRLPADLKQEVLDAGAENVLKGIAGVHQGSIEEAYAALRDLGITAVMYKVDESGKPQGTQVFGAVKSNFRAEYD